MAAKVEMNKKVPAFSLPASGGKSVSFEDLKGKKVVLYFYPKDNTPGCTTEGIEFNRLVPQFKKLNTVVFGVSRDSIKSHDKFSSMHDFKFSLLADEKEQLCKMFDVIKEKNMYGKKVMGIERSTFVISEDQKLIGEFRKIKAEGHATEILDFIKGL